MQSFCEDVGPVFYGLIISGPVFCVCCPVGSGILPRYVSLVLPEVFHWPACLCRLLSAKWTGGPQNGTISGGFAPDLRLLCFQDQLRAMYGNTGRPIGELSTF